MKKTKLFGLTALLFSLGLTACPGGTDTPDDPPEGELQWVSTAETHYQVDARGTRKSAAEPHDLVDFEGDATHVNQPATCSSPGIVYKKCTVCGKVVSNDLKKLDHVWEEVPGEGAASCTSGGTITYKCKNCSKTKEETSGTPLGHDFGAATVVDANATGAIVKKSTCSRCNLASYIIDVSTAKMALEGSSKWKNDPSTGVCKLNGDNQSYTFSFALPASFKGKMYQRAYMDSYSANKSKKLYYETDSVSNIDVLINNNKVDTSAQNTTTFADIFGDDLDGSNSTVKDVLIGNVNLTTSNTVSFTRVKTLNMLVSAFVFVEDPAE